MKMRWTSILAAALLVGAVACGDDDPKSTNNVAANNTTSNNTTANNTSANNTSANNTSANNTSANNMGVVADVQEVEPNGLGEGDTPTPFTLGQSVGGTIAEGAGQEGSDLDRFSFTGEAGQVVTVSVEAAGPGTQDLGTDQLVVVVASEDDAVVRNLVTSAGLTSREVFLPQSGTYYLEVLDERYGGDVTHGGDDATYVIGTSVSSPEPDAIDVPSQTDGDSSDGSIAAYTLNVPEATVVELETFAGRLATPSELDTVLVVFDPATSTLVATNDDFLPQEDEIYDSKTAFSAEANKDYLVVVDAYSATPNGAFRLDATATDDSASAPTIVTAGDTVNGDIEAKDGAEFDTDYFQITLERNQFARIEVTGSDQLQPRILLELEGIGVIGEARPVGQSAAIEFAAGDFEDPQVFNIIVDDVRNVPEEGEGDDVGGSGFDYTLAATSITWTPTAVTLPYSQTGTVTNVGDTNWYSFDVAAGDVLVADVITTEMNFKPIIVQLTEQNFDAPVGDTPYIVGASEATTFTFGVRDEFFRGRASAEYLVDFETVTPTVVAETEPNDDQAGAQSVTLPTRITGVTDGTNETDTSPDYFSFSATNGQSLVIFTGPGTDETPDSDADTVITLLDSNGTELATNDDISFGNTFSQINFDVTADGTYTLVVEPYCSASECSNGDYSATIVAN